jgi:Glycosyl transferase family 2
MMSEISVALCAIVRNEIRSIIEWLAHYKALGFSEFLIYDNDSDDGTAEVLQALDDAGELVYLDWPHAVGQRPQRLAYANARTVATAEWLAFFDADEFLFLREDATIQAFLARFDAGVSAIAVNWIVFGSGGQRHYAARPVVERFTDALPALAAPNHQVKAIGRRERLVGTGIHRVALHEGRYVNPSGEDVEFVGLTSVTRPDVTVAALHHYAVKSLEEFQEKRLRGHANSQSPDVKRARLDEAFAAFDAGGVTNTDILVRVPAIRAEAARLAGLLRAAGLEFPVWPFVEEAG